MNSHPSEQAERVRDLLQELLAPICTARKLGQLAKLDIAEVARDAWRDFLIENPALEADTWWFSAEICGVLDAMIVASLGDAMVDDSASFETQQTVNPEVLTMASMEALLGDWLSRWRRQLCVIDPQSAEIMLLRLRGFGNRAISEGLETGLRLVNRIVADIRTERMESGKVCGKEVA